MGELLAVVAVTAIFALLYRDQERRHARERELLLNRIQDPVTAIAQATPPSLEPVVAVPYDDDDAYWRARTGVTDGGS